MPKKPKIRELEVRLHSEREKNPLRIVADAAIATASLGQGKLIPLVILDTSERPDVEEFVRVHSYLPSGDVTVSWTQYPRGKDNLCLLVQGLRPSEVTFLISFDLNSPQWVIVDQIIRSRALYVQPGRSGERLKTTLDKPRILVEVGDLGFDDAWDYLLNKAMIRRLRSEGLNKSQAKDATKKLIAEWRREFGNLRLLPNQGPVESGAEEVKNER